MTCVKDATVHKLEKKQPKNTMFPKIKQYSKKSGNSWTSTDMKR